MARTAHHVRRSGAPDGDPAWRRVVLYDLRYSSRALADAAREGRRPRPCRVRREVAVYTFLRSGDDRGIAVAASIAERRARARLRNRMAAVLAAVRTPSGSVLGTALDAPASAGDADDVPPVRHRHGALE